MIRILRKLSITNTLRCTSYSSIRLYSKKSDDPTVPVEDEFELKSSSNSFSRKRNAGYRLSRKNNESLIELLENLPSSPNNITIEVLIEFYVTVKGAYLFSPSIKKHPKYNSLCEATKNHLPQLSTRQIKDVFIAILPSKTIMHDRLGEIISEALVNRAQHIPFEQIVFVDFLINKYYNSKNLSKSFNILRMRLQTLFLTKIEDEMEELDSFEDLMKIVSYCQNNSEIIPSKIINLLTTSLLLADDEHFDINDIKTVLIFLANLGKLNERVEKLLRKMIGLWYKSPVTANDVQTLLKVLAAKNSTNKIDKEFFENLEFIRHCVNIVTEQNNKQITFSVQNSFNKMGIVNVELTEHLSKVFESVDDARKLTVGDYIILCTACARADYKPKNWDYILEALKTFKFYIYINALGDFDWADFALNLYKLGHCNLKFIRKIVFSKHLQKKRKFDEKKINKLREILEREDSSSSSSDSDSLSSSDDDLGNDEDLFADLKGIFGPNKFWTNVYIDSEITIPFVMKMDLQSGDFLSTRGKPFSQHSEDGKLLVGVLVSNVDDDEQDKLNAENQSDRLDKMGWSTICLDKNKWDNLKAYEKSLEFYSKIVDMMENYENKR